MNLFYLSLSLLYIFTLCVRCKYSKFVLFLIIVIKTYTLSNTTIYISNRSLFSLSLIFSLSLWKKILFFFNPKNQRKFKKGILFFFLLIFFDINMRSDFRKSAKKKKENKIQLFLLIFFHCDMYKKERESFLKICPFVFFI